MWYRSFLKDSIGHLGEIEESKLEFCKNSAARASGCLPSTAAGRELSPRKLKAIRMEVQQVDMHAGGTE